LFILQERKKERKKKQSRFFDFVLFHSKAPQPEVPKNMKDEKTQQGKKPESLSNGSS